MQQLFPNSFLLSLPSRAIRLLLFLLSADLGTMIIMNAAHLRTSVLPWVFAACLIFAFFLFRKAVSLDANGGSAISAANRRKLILLALALIALCSLPRLVYLTEPFQHALKHVIIFDDEWHIQELNSLTNSPSYPAISSFNDHYYFSFYYAAWMLPAALYLALPVHFITLKFVYGLATAIYITAGVLALVYLMISLARSASHIWSAAYLIGAYAGGASLVSCLRPLQHNGSWIRSLGMNLEYTSFPVLLLFVIHHLLAAIALLIASYLWQRQTPQWRDVLLCAMLSAFAFYSSVFVVIGALPLAGFLLLRSFRKHRSQTLALLLTTTLLVLPLLWLYLGKVGGVGFQFVSKHGILLALGSHHHFHVGVLLGFAIFLLILGVNFLPQVAVLCKSAGKLSSLDITYVCLALLFLLSTYWIRFSLYNNYCMRGSIVPIIILSWVAARHARLPRKNILTVALLIVGMAGSLNEIAIFNRSMLSNLIHNRYGAAGATVLAWNENRSIHELPSDEVQPLVNADPEIYYEIEKLVPNIQRPLVPSDLETLSKGPRGVWSFEHGPTTAVASREGLAH